MPEAVEEITAGRTEFVGVGREDELDVEVVLDIGKDGGGAPRVPLLCCGAPLTPRRRALWEADVRLNGTGGWLELGGSTFLRKSIRLSSSRVRFGRVVGNAVRVSMSSSSSDSMA